VTRNMVPGQKVLESESYGPFIRENDLFLRFLGVFVPKMARFLNYEWYCNFDSSVFQYLCFGQIWNSRCFRNFPIYTEVFRNSVDWRLLRRIGMIERRSFDRRAGSKVTFSWEMWDERV
jgi:hypothetical protein